MAQGQQRCHTVTQQSQLCLQEPPCAPQDSVPPLSGVPSHTGPAQGSRGGVGTARSPARIDDFPLSREAPPGQADVPVGSGAPSIPAGPGERPPCGPRGWRHRSPSGERETHTWLSFGVSRKASAEMCCSPELEMVLKGGKGSVDPEFPFWEHPLYLLAVGLSSGDPPAPLSPVSPGCSQVPEVPQRSGVSSGQGRQRLLVLDGAGRRRRGLRVAAQDPWCQGLLAKPGARHGEGHGPQGSTATAGDGHKDGAERPHRASVSPGMAEGDPDGAEPSLGARVLTHRMSSLGLNPAHPLGPHLVSHPRVPCTVTGAPLSLSPHPFSGQEVKKSPFGAAGAGFFPAPPRRPLL